MKNNKAIKTSKATPVYQVDMTIYAYGIHNNNTHHLGNNMAMKDMFGLFVSDEVVVMMEELTHSRIRNAPN